MDSRITVNQAKLKQRKRQEMVVSRFQAKAALENVGLLEQVQQFMNDPETPLITRLAWEDAMEFRRLSPTIVALSNEFGLTEEELDNLFEMAKTIEA